MTPSNETLYFGGKNENQKHETLGEARTGAKKLIILLNFVRQRQQGKVFFLLFIGASFGATLH